MADTVWNRIFKKDGRVFEQPHEEVVRFADRLKAAGAHTVFDLGCGSGRHSVYLAGQGFEVYGLDSSDHGLEIATDWLANEHLQADLRLGDMHDPLPYPDECFDAAISIQAIHHGLLSEVLASIAELKRVIRPGGLVLVTAPVNRRAGRQDKILEPNTFLPLDGREAGLLHHIFSAEELVEAFWPFDTVDLHVEERGRHYCLIARKPLNDAGAHPDS